MAGAVPQDARHSTVLQREAAVGRGLAGPDAELALQHGEEALGAAHRAGSCCGRPAGDVAADAACAGRTCVYQCSTSSIWMAARRCRRRARPMSDVGDIAAVLLDAVQAAAAPARSTSRPGKRIASKLLANSGDHGASPVALPADHVDRAEGRHDVRRAGSRPAACACRPCGRSWARARAGL